MSIILKFIVYQLILSFCDNSVDYYLQMKHADDPIEIRECDPSWVEKFLDDRCEFSYIKL